MARDTDKMEKMDVQVQCGDCYQQYDIAKNETCPYCGSAEIVGDR